ncbi:MULTISPECIES: O-unit flippase-like protein [unclassified Dysgonomonas]|uniref:O-unit flippase-like protein n=1 Tax=unclassified Dysgonomonas TaxID=2630389 RepID=UPI002475F627|nr:MULTISPECIES: O-unit flippase-like protein [unclassified Dysgonomonas]
MGNNTPGKIKLSKTDVIWSYVAQIFNVGANIIVLPFVLRILSTEVLAIWYVFVAVQSFVTLLDFGFQGAFTRNVTYTFSGATSLLKRGIDPSAEVLDRPNYALLKSLIKSMRRFYGYTSIGMLVILATAGTYYISHVTSQLENSHEIAGIMNAWYVFIVANVFSFFFHYFQALIMGRGLIKENNILIIITKSVYMLATAVGLNMGYGIMSLAIATGLSVIVNRIVANLFFYKGGLRLILKQTQALQQNMLPIIWYNASKVGIAELAIFFTTKGNTFFAPLFLPLSLVGQYSVTMHAVAFLSTLSQLYFLSHVPVISQCRIERNKAKITSIFGESVVIMSVTYILGALFLILFGDSLLGMFSDKSFLPTLPFALLLLVYYLDVNHVLPLLLLITKNEMPYLKASLISGFSIGILSPLFMGVFHWGIYGIIAAVGIVQALYHNWKWPLEAIRDLGMSYKNFYRIGYHSLQTKILYLRK